MNTFYHSKDWGFDTSVLKKRENAMSFLNSIGLHCCIKCICDQSMLESVFRELKGHRFLVIIIDIITLEYTGFFDITNCEQLSTQVNRVVNDNFRQDRIRYCFIDQMQECPGCFTSNIISDGKGNAIIEFIVDTVDNRYLTSGGQYVHLPKRILFNDYKMVYCDNYKVLMRLWESIKTCLFFKGYYECSFALVNNQKDVYFTYYSNEEIYQNITLDHIDYDMFKYRCAFLSLIDL